MRIGDVNKDNYKEYLKLFNLKNTKEIEKSIDNVLGKDKEEKFDLEAAEKRMIAMGYAEEGMIIDGHTDDGSWKKIVPVTDDIKEKIIETVRRQFLTNGDGTIGRDDFENEIGNIMKEYRKNIAPSDRLSVTWTLNKVVTQEGQRLMDYVKANMPPDWKPGEPIEPDVLKAAVSSEHFDTKA